MTSAQNLNPSLDDLATTAVRLGRALDGLTRGVSLCGENEDIEAVNQMLRHLAERNPFDPGVNLSLEVLRDILDADLRCEVVGRERQFFETRFDEYGQHGEVRDCPIYSERGHELLAVRDAIHAFIAARDATLDRVAAQRALRQFLPT